MALMAASLWASEKPYIEHYSKWMNLPSRKLLDMGHKFAEVTGHPDSAMVCFTIVTSRYNANLSKEEQRLASVAYISKWYLYFFTYFDYAKAFENLSAAQDISKHTGREQARILLNFGCMYQTLAEQNDNADLNRKAYDYYRKAFRMGISQGDKRSTLVSFGNLVSVAFSLDSLESIGDEYQEYKKLGNDEHLPYNEMQYEGLKDMSNGKYAEALALFEKQYQLSKDWKGYERFQYVAILNQARALAGVKRYVQAIEKMRQLETLAETYDIKDAKMEVYHTMADYYTKKGDKQGSLLYRDKYFRLKNILQNYQQVASVSNLHFLNELRKMDDQLAQMNRRRHIQDVAIVVVATVAVAFALFLFVINKKNKALRKKNEVLYQRSLESIAAPVGQAPAQKKYQNSTLNEDEKENIMQRVLQIMDNSDEIYSPDFNVERLAQLAESKSKYVSQVINEKYNDNFNALVNKYRIREACRRLSDTEHYGQYTIDAISKSVGFRSRNTFVVGFRRFTGLTPSEFQRIAKDGVS